MRSLEGAKMHRESPFDVLEKHPRLCLRVRTSCDFAELGRAGSARPRRREESGGGCGKIRSGVRTVRAIIRTIRNTGSIARHSAFGLVFMSEKPGSLGSAKSQTVCAVADRNE